MAEVMIPPWVRPESPETIRMIDDATVAFQPAFGRGMTQRGIWADPRWGLRRRYRGLRSDEQAAILNALSETRGQLNKLLVTPHTPVRGTFPATELFTNPTFGSGTTSWTSSAEYTHTVSDRVLRALRVSVTGGPDALVNSSAITVSQYVPYALRMFIARGTNSYTDMFQLRVGVSAGAADYGAASGLGYGMQTLVSVPYGTSVFTDLLDANPGLLSGDYLSITYTSFARCALVDNGVNLLLQSDEFDTTWGTSSLSVDDQAAVAPDGTSTADSLIEGVAGDGTVAHYASQAITIPSNSGLDYCLSVAAQSNGRSWVFIRMIEGTGAQSATAWFNLATGAVGSTSTTGANWASLRSFTKSLGGAYTQCTLVARKTNAATSLTILIGPSTGDGVVNYTGNGTSAIFAWRATLSRSSVPSRLVATTTAALSTGADQPAGGLYVKGLPISTNGLLESGDWIEVAGQLKRVTARLNSDILGMGYLQFRPALGSMPVDNDPVIIKEPFGRFIYPGGTRELENLFGIYGDCEMNLEEIYA